jgi:hypothetical protein
MPFGGAHVSDTSRSIAQKSGERYTEQQLAEILRRAAERQEGLTSETDGRFSLAEIQQIASEVGIAPAHVEAAAAELQQVAPLPAGGALGAPTAFRFEQWIDGEVPTSAIGELFDIARTEVGLQGQVSEALDTVEWRGRGSMGSTVVSVARRNGRSKISVYISRSDTAMVVVTTTGVGGFFTALGIGTALGATAVVGGPIAIAATVAVSLGWAGGGTWLSMRGIWRRIARTWAERTNALGTQLVAAAQRAVETARKDSG